MPPLPSSFCRHDLLFVLLKLIFTPKSICVIITMQIEVIIMNNKDIILSIIVPVYNVEDYIEECLESLINQDIPTDNYEIICVNDGSTDNSGKILSSYSKKYNNLLVINKENGGVGSARNAGIDTAQGNYIWFVDADDFIKPYSLSTVTELINNNHFDYLKVKPYSFNHGEKFSPQDISIEMSQKSIKNFLWTYILRRDYIVNNNIYFETNISYAEDAVFMLQVNPFLIKEGKVDDVLYFYRQRPGSAMSQNLSKKIRSRINGALVCEEIIQGVRLGSKESALNFKYNSITKTMGMIVKLPKCDRKAFENELIANNLFPLQKNKEFKPSNNNKSKLIKRVQNNLINNSYTKWGYLRLLIFTNLINIPKTIKSFIKHN